MENKEIPETANEINIIDVKLPPFWKCDSAAWFKRTEDKLYYLSHIISKSRTKFDQVLTMFDEYIIEKKHIS